LYFAPGSSSFAVHIALHAVIPKAGIQYAAASRFCHTRSGVLDHPLSRV